MSPTEQPAAFFRLRGGGHKIATGSRRGATGSKVVCRNDTVTDGWGGAPVTASFDD
jgi:hypothetical protein